MNIFPEQEQPRTRYTFAQWTTALLALVAFLALLWGAFELVGNISKPTRSVESLVILLVLSAAAPCIKELFKVGPPDGFTLFWSAISMVAMAGILFVFRNDFSISDSGQSFIMMELFFAGVIPSVMKR